MLAEVSLYSFLRFAGDSYGRFTAVLLGLICQCMFRTIGDRQEGVVRGRYLNGKMVGSR